MNRVSVFHRLILFSVEAYLDDIKADGTYQYEFMLKLRSKLRSYIQGHRFSREEFLIVRALAETDAIKAMSALQIDRTIYSLELLVYFIQQIPKSDRPFLNMSDTKILTAKAELIKDMMQMRQEKKESYDRVKDVITDSRINAKKYFHYCDDQIVGKYLPSNASR